MGSCSSDAAGRRWRRPAGTTRSSRISMRGSGDAVRSTPTVTPSAAVSLRAGSSTSWSRSHRSRESSGRRVEPRRSVGWCVADAIEHEPRSLAGEGLVEGGPLVRSAESRGGLAQESRRVVRARERSADGCTGDLADRCSEIALPAWPAKVLGKLDRVERAGRWAAGELGGLEHGSPLPSFDGCPGGAVATEVGVGLGSAAGDRNPHGIAVLPGADRASSALGGRGHEPPRLWSGDRTVDAVGGEQHLVACRVVEP
jgi:hypothetical protein